MSFNDRVVISALVRHLPEYTYPKFAAVSRAWRDTIRERLGGRKMKHVTFRCVKENDYETLVYYHKHGWRILRLSCFLSVDMSPKLVRYLYRYDLLYEIGQIEDFIVSVNVEDDLFQTLEKQVRAIAEFGELINMQTLFCLAVRTEQIGLLNWINQHHPLVVTSRGWRSGWAPRSGIWLIEREVPVEGSERHDSIYSEILNDIIRHSNEIDQMMYAVRAFLNHLRKCNESFEIECSGFGLPELAELLSADECTCRNHAPGKKRIKYC